MEQNGVCMKTPLLLLHHSSPVPPYEQIRLQICTLIASGQLLEGDQLPSVRQLARDLGVAPNTVVRAYNELEREDWVVTSTRRSVSVAPHPPISTQEGRRQKLEQAVSEFLVVVHQLGASAEEVQDEIDRQIGMTSKRLLHNNGELTR